MVFASLGVEYDHFLQHGRRCVVSNAPGMLLAGAFAQLTDTGVAARILSAQRALLVKGSVKHMEARSGNAEVRGAAKPLSTPKVREAEALAQLT